VQRLVHGLPSPLTLLRIGLIAFVLVWLFGPYTLRSAVPIWLPFLIALGLELHFFVGGLRPAPARRADRGPQADDRQRYGYGDDAEELLLVREGDQELWIPYSGETDEELSTLIDEALENQEEGEEEEESAPAVAADPERRRRVRPPLRRFVVGLGLIGALALTFWIVENRTGWNGLDASTRAAAAARFSEEASRVAMKPVTIRCDESGDYVGAVQHADGVAALGGDLAYLTPERCLDLYRLAFKGEMRSSRTARALAVLAHEAWHLRGVSDEGTTECYALQTGVEIGQRLGLSADTARRTMRQQLVENASRGQSSPDYRVPPDCREGGRLDLNPDIARFP
jgi:predicted RNase H-like HicB family nuclease